MDVVGHNDERAEFVMAQFDTTKQRLDHQLGNGFLPEKQRARSSSVQLAVHPDKGLASRGEVRRRVLTPGKAAMQMKADKQPTAFRVQMGEPARVHSQ